MMNGRVLSLEKNIRRAPLALRFIDLLLEKPIGDGLEVQAWPLVNQQIPRYALPVTASRSLQSGIYGFNSLEGLRDYEMDRRPHTDFCPDDTAPFNYVITVRDRLGRYQPVTLAYCLPKTQVVEVRLLPTVNRLMPDTFGVVRVELWDSPFNRPAADALVQVSLNANNYIGLADSRGMAAVFVEYPPLPKSEVDADDHPIPITWAVKLQVFYRPPDPALPKDPGEYIQIPGQATEARLYSSILQQMTVAPAVLLKASPPEDEATELDMNLQYRVDLIVKTLGNDSAGQPFSRLELRPAP